MNRIENLSKTTINALLAAAVVALMSACGGGGGGGPTPGNPDPGNPGNPDPGPTGATPTDQGRLLYDPGAGKYLTRLNLQNGQAVELPKSELAGSYLNMRDYWYVGTSGRGDLVREDKNGKVSFHDRTSLAATAGGFDIARLAGTDQPALYGSTRLSPDGTYVLSYFKANYRSDQPALTVMDRQGAIIEAGSPLSYDRNEVRDAIDWLPDGRYVYLAGARIVIARPGQGIVGQVPLALPAGASLANSSLRASPDGQRLLLTLQTSVNATDYGLLYTVNLDGSNLRQLTAPSARLQQSQLRSFHAGATWSPDGRWIAFAARGVNPAAPGNFDPCAPVIVLSSEAATFAVDGISDPADKKLTLNTGNGGKQVVVDCGGIPLGWQ